MSGTVPYISILMLNVNGLNALLKKYRMNLKTHKPNICCLQETQLTHKDAYRFKVKVEKYILFKQNPKVRWSSCSYIK